MTWRSATRTLGLMLGVLISSGLDARAQGGGPGGGGPGGGGPGGGGPGGMVGIAVVVPPDATDVRLVAEVADAGSAVGFTDDGTFAIDLPRDREWWAFMTPPPAPDGFTLRIAGTVDDHQVFHEETVRVPSAWMSGTYPVTFLAVPESLGWRLDRVLSGALPELESGSTGAGVSELVRPSGLSVSTAYILWGILLASAMLAAVLRSSVLRARAELG